MDQYQTPSLWRKAENCPIIHPEAAKDCILPDAYPDIHRILYTYATVNPGRTTWSADKLRTDGSLYATVLFSDDEGAMHTVRFSIDYNGQMPFEMDGEEYTVIADTLLHSVSARAQNPRRLAIRGRLTVTPQVFVRCSDEPQMSSELSRISLEKKLQTLSCWKVQQWMEQGIEASEDLSLTQEAPIAEIVWSDLQFEITSCEMGDKDVRFSGNGVLHLFYQTVGGGVQYTNVTFPIRSSVSGDFPQNATCRVMLIPGQISVMPVEDATGEARSVELDFTYSVQILAAWKADCTRAIDCYSIDLPIGARTETVRVLSGVKETAIELERVVEGEVGALSTVLHTAVQMGIESREQSNEGTVLHCTAQITLLGKGEGGAPISVNLTDNFPITLPATDGMYERLQCDGVPIVSMDGDRVKVTLSVKLTCWVTDSATVSFVGSILPASDAMPSAADSITLYYPAPGETAWDVAKRYRISPGVLASVNSLPEEGLPTVLLIPR